MDEKRPTPHAARGITDYDAPTALWREGPVRYLLTKDEDDAFRALTTDEDRAAFIHRFWASRDPVGSTPENEYRAIFYARVADANRRLTDSTKPGWKTHRGKIFILLGPPDHLEQQPGGIACGRTRPPERESRRSGRLRRRDRAGHRARPVRSGGAPRGCSARLAFIRLCPA